VKESATRWQDTSSETVASHDVVLAFEERIFDAVIEDLQTRDPGEFKPVLVICLDTKDNPAEAAKAGLTALEMCWRIEKCEDLLSEAGDIIEEFGEQKMKESSVKILYQICYL
jgi:RNA polymerase II subunit A C-terminal domain phosphatase SSU72